MYEAPEVARTKGGFIDDDRDIAIFAARNHCSPSNELEIATHTTSTRYSE